MAAHALLLNALQILIVRGVRFAAAVIALILASAAAANQAAYVIQEYVIREPAQATLIARAPANSVQAIIAQQHALRAATAQTDAHVFLEIARFQYLHLMVNPVAMLPWQ